MTSTRVAAYQDTLQEELEAIGLWSLIQDPTLTDVIVSADGTIHTHGFDGPSLLPEPVPPELLHTCLATIAGIHRRVLDQHNPILEVSLPFQRVRVTAIAPPISPGPILVLRIPPRRLLTLEDLVGFDSMPTHVADLLGHAILDGATILVAGAVSSGKTVLASAILDHWLTHRPNDRLVLIEEGAREIQVPERATVHPLLTPSVDELPVTKLFRVSLRLSPDRIVLGELRGAEALDFVKAALSGHPGLATVHAASAHGAIARLTDLLEESGSPPSPARVARSVDLIVHVARSKGRRFVQEVLRLDEPDPQGRFATESLYEA